MRFVAMCAAGLVLAAPLSFAGQPHPKPNFEVPDLVSEAPPASFFANRDDRTWFSHCEYQRERYVVCKNSDQVTLDLILKPETTPSAALQSRMQKIFEANGCTFDAPPDTFRVNGIFLSVDLENAKGIRCGDKEAKIVFKPGVMELLDTIYFILDGPPH